MQALLELFTDYPGWLVGISVFLGLLVGSFLNVVIYRLPKMLDQQWRQECVFLLESTAEEKERAETEKGLLRQCITLFTGNSGRFNLLFPPSHCPVCDKPVKPWQNLPIVSYLLLRGRCNGCGTPISLRYPAIELLTGLLFGVVACYSGAAPLLLGGMLFTAMLISMTFIDVDTQLLPDNLTLPLLWAGLLFNLWTGYVPLVDAVLGAAAGYLSLWAVYWLFKLATGKEGMGYGDFKLLAALGAWLGWQQLPVVILLSSFVGALFGVVLIVLARHGRGKPMPFGPYLASAGWIAFIWGNSIVTWYLSGL